MTENTNNRKDKTIMRECIAALGDYAALVAADNHSTAIADKLRSLIEDIVPYWGLDNGVGAKSADEFISELEDKVHATMRSTGLDVDTYSACADALTGLAQHGTDLINAHGNDTFAMKQTLHVGGLMNEIADYYGINEEMTYASDTNRQFRNTVKGLLERTDLPGNEVEGIVNVNYAIKQAVLYDNGQGFAFAHNPNAASPYVTWEMYENDKGQLGFEIGSYFQNKEEALVDYISRAEGYAARYKVTEKPLPAAEIPQLKPLIQFIDSGYREQFKIPDGDSIRITYPPDDGREPAERECKHMGETHVRIGSSLYHICEFAAAMERVGAKVEPVNQVQNIRLEPYNAGIDDEKFFIYNREEGNTCAGSLHGDFGNDGKRYHASWNERENNLYTPEIQSEVQSVVYALRKDLLKDRTSMLAYCQDNPGAKISEGNGLNGNDYETYGFKLETEKRQYFVNCFANGRDSRFAVYAYADKPMLEQSNQLAGQANLKIYHADFYDPEIDHRMEIIIAKGDAEAIKKAMAICEEADGIVLDDLNEIDEDGNSREVSFNEPLPEVLPDLSKEIAALLKRVNAVLDGRVTSREDNLLQIITDGRKLGIEERYLQPIIDSSFSYKDVAKKQMKVVDDKSKPQVKEPPETSAKPKKPYRGEDR